MNVRAGQDSGYFFLGPTVDALTYAADAGIDVVNMSFYVDPWLYNCPTAGDYLAAPAGQADGRPSWPTSRSSTPPCTRPSTTPTRAA